MATTKRTRIAAALMLLVLIGAVAFVVFGLRGDKNAQPGKTTDSALTEPATGTSESGSPDSTASAESGGKTATSTGATTSTAKKRALAVKDTPVPPAVPTQPSQPDAWQQYLDQTKQIVTANTDSLSALAARTTQALAAHDSAELGSLIAPDEGSQTGYAASLADRYPTITASTPSPTVNIFIVNSATVYITYVLVTWQDAGIISQHTIPVALRFVNGTWYLTTLDDSTDGLQFVQTVQL